MTLPFRPDDLRRLELPSGATVLALPYRRLPLLHIVLMLKHGAEVDPRDKGGLSDLVAEALTLGTERKGAEELSLAVERLGASISASSGWDRSFLKVVGLAEDVEELLSLAGEVYLHPSFPPDEIAKALQRRMANLTKSRDEAERVADELIWCEMMAGTPYDHPSYGTMKSVKALSREDVVALYNRVYSPRDTVLLIVGPLAPEELLRQGEELLGDWSFPSPYKKFPNPPSLRGRKILLVDKPDLTQSQIRIGFTGFERKAPCYLPFKVMNYILGGGGFSSRLMERVRSQKGFTYGIRSSIHPMKVPGPLIISTFTPTETTLQTFREILATLEDFLKGGVTDKELEEAKGYFCGNFPLRLETPGQVAREILELELYGLGLDELEFFTQRVQEVSVEDVLRVASEVLDLGAFRAIVLGRVKDLEGAFRDWGEVEIKSFADVASQ